MSNPLYERKEQAKKVILVAVEIKYTYLRT